MKRIVILIFSLLALGGLAAAEEISAGGTFQKGPALGGKLRVHGPIVVITGETAFGTVTGGILTGSVEYSTRKETINEATGNGEFHITMFITKENGSRIVVDLDGDTTGAFPSAEMVNISGTWHIVSSSGPDAPLQGKGNFSGTEDFQTGATTGNFSGTLRLH